MLLPCQPAARSRPLVPTRRIQIRPERCYSRRALGLALLIALLLILTGRGRAASSQPATRYASRIVETKSGQIRGILQVRIDSSRPASGRRGEGGGDEGEDEVSSEEAILSCGFQLGWIPGRGGERSDVDSAWIVNGVRNARLVLVARRRCYALRRACPRGEEGGRFMAGLIMRNLPLRAAHVARQRYRLSSG